MTALVPFLFEDEHLVRTMMRADEPWLVLADVCRVLDIGAPHQAAARLDEDEKTTINTRDNIAGINGCDIADGPQETGTLFPDPRVQSLTLISESGLYSLILTSRKPAAKRFKKWVTAVVLPAIRKTGSYSTGKARGRPPHVQHGDGPNYQGQIQAIRLMKELKGETNPAIRRTLHAMLTGILIGQGIDVPSLDAIGQDAPPPPPVPPILVEFWAPIAALDAAGIRVNHSPDPELVAINLTDLRRHIPTGKLPIPIDGELRRALQRSTTPCFVGVKTVRSRLAKDTVRCWVFRRVSA